MKSDLKNDVKHVDYVKDDVRRLSHGDRPMLL